MHRQGLESETPYTQDFEKSIRTEREHTQKVHDVFVVELHQDRQFLGKLGDGNFVADHLHGVNFFQRDSLLKLKASIYLRYGGAFVNTPSCTGRNTWAFVGKIDTSRWQEHALQFIHFNVVF